MKNIALIPARSGSKRLKDKNIQKILDLELFLWTLRSVKSSKYIDRIIFSTDSDKYVDLCLKDAKKENYQCEIDFRDEEGAGDNVKIYDYIKSQKFLQKNNISADDRLILLLPTCPLRPEFLIDEVISYSDKKNKSVFSCCEYDFHVNFAFSIEDDNDSCFTPLFGEKSPMISGNTRSQDQSNFFRPNGSIYSVFLRDILNSNAYSIYYNSLPYIMSKIYSCDIDNEIQLKIANSNAFALKNEFNYILNKK